MSFDRPPDAYARFMGVYADPLAEQFVRLLVPGPPEPGGLALDVGSGTGILTDRLVRLFGATAVAAIEPSPAFAAATAARFPGSDVRRGVAEDLPWDDDTFVAVGAQLVVHFMTDPVRGLSEMLRVTRPGGRVAACVWDHAGDGTPLAAFWRGAHAVDPDARDESDLAGSTEGHLAELLERAGARDVTAGALEVSVTYPSFESWWAPYTLGIGPAGDYVLGLDDDHRKAIAAVCRAELGDGPLTIRATAWCASATA